MTLIRANAADSFDWVHDISGNRDDQVRSLAVGKDGSIYIAGLTTSTDFVSTAGALDVTQGTVFVRRLAPDGRQVLYSATVGVSNLSSPVAIGVDVSGNALVAYGPELIDGLTTRSLEAGGGCTIVKISPDGSRFLYRVAVLPNLYRNLPIGFAVEPDGSVYIASGESSIAVRRIDPDGTRIVNQMDAACTQGSGLSVNALAIGPDHSVHIAGKSLCGSFPASANAYRAVQQTLDGYVMRLAPDLSATLFSTLLGASVDEALALAVGADGTVTVGGNTRPSNRQFFPADFLGVDQPRPNTPYGFVAAVSADGSTLKGGAILSTGSVTALSTDPAGNIYAAGTSFYGAFFAKVSPDLKMLQYMVEPPAKNALIASAVHWGTGLLFAGSATTAKFPDNDPSSLSLGLNGFVGFLRDEPLAADLQLTVQARLATPEVFGSYTACRFVMTNRGPNDASQVMLLAAIEENAAFQLWRADQPVFNVPTFSTGFAGPTPAAIAHLAAGESATIEFLSNNLIFSNGIQCSGKLYSSTGELSPLQTSGVDAGKPNSIQVTINSGLNFRRDDWPILYSGSVAARLTATPNSQMRIYFPSPQKNASGRIIKFERWSDGSTDNPRTFTLGGQDVSYTYVTTTLPSDTPIGTDLYGGDFSSPPDTAVTTSYLQPYEISAGTAEPSVIVNGTGLRKGWVGLWNGQPRPTQYLNSYQLRVMLLAEDVESPSSVGFRFVIPSAMRSSG